MTNSRESIHQLIKDKAVLKQDVYTNTLANFKDLKTVLGAAVEDIKNSFGNADRRVEFYFQDKGDFQAEIKIAGDVLVFYMHTNVFQFDKTNNIWQTKYVKDNDQNSYVGIINVYNFLADSFKYQRNADLGYLIARIFINKENHFMVQGKRQLGVLYNDFVNDVISHDKLNKIVDSCILYTLDFDLFTPPYENLQQVTVDEIQSVHHSASMATGKRIGFRFGLDEVVF